MILNARRIFTSSDQKPTMLLAMEDITRQKQLEDQLKAYTKRLTIEVAKRTAQLEARVHELEETNKKLRKHEVQPAELKAQFTQFKDPTQA